MVLISILGDFHSSIFPIFYEFKDSITKHIVVYDDAFAKLKQNKDTIVSLENFSKKRSLPIRTEGYVIQEDSYESIDKLITMIENLDEKNDVYVNATDGLSNITVLFGRKLLSRGIKIIAYDMFANTYNITSSNAIEKKSLTKEMSIQDHFLFKGLEIVGIEDKSFAEKNAGPIRELFENYADEFKALKRGIASNNLKPKRYPRALQIIKSLGFNVQTQQKEITGGLFEWYVYLLVKDLGFSDIEVGVIVNDSFSTRTSVKNEFDILLMKDNHLHMIECKFTERIDLQALVYKYSSLINLIDDDGRMMILTEKNEYAPDLYDHTKMGLESYRRAHKNRIIIRNSIVKNRAKFIEDVKSYFSLQ